MGPGVCHGPFFTSHLGTPMPAGIVKDLRVVVVADTQPSVSWRFRAQIHGLGSSVGGVVYQCSIDVPGASACDTVSGAEEAGRLAAWTAQAQPGPDASSTCPLGHAWSRSVTAPLLPPPLRPAPAQARPRSGPPPRRSP
jgi:hypothetical protein